MRALRADKDSLLDTRSPEPTPGPGEAIVRVTAAALTAHDAVLARQSTGQILGTDFVGVVESLHPASSPADRKEWTGVRVVASPVISCTGCDLCQRGLAIHCRNKSVLGAPGRDGGLAERITLPVRNLFRIPDHLDDEAAVFVNPVSLALHAARSLGLAPSASAFVTVLGDRCPGLIAAQVLARRYTSVRLLGSDPARYVLCEKWGVKHRHGDEPGRRQDQDAVVCTSATAAELALAAQLVRPRGTIALFRPDTTAPAVPAPMTIFENEVTLTGVSTGDAAEAINLLARGGVDTASLITRRARLDEIETALRLATEPDQIRVIVTM